MSAKHRTSRILPWRRPATAIVERITGRPVTDQVPTRHDGSQDKRRGGTS